MDEIIQALVGIGFSQSGAEGQLREINDLILRKAALKMLGESPNPLNSENDIKVLIEMYYSPDEFRKVFSQIAGEVMEDYYRAVSARLSAEQRDIFYKQLMSSVPAIFATSSTVPQAAY